MPKPAKPQQNNAPDSEKITLNLGYVDLGRIDLLVREGFYANRSDFIRTAIRNQLDAQEGVVRQSLERHSLELGLRIFTRRELEEARAEGVTLHVRVVGLARFDDDITPELARAAIGSLTVLGALQAGKHVKDALSALPH